MATFLVVDDAMFMRMMLKDIITECGHQVIGEADSGDEAVALYATLKPDVVTMDIVMPGKSGVTATKDILALDPKARVTMVTSVGQQEVAVDALTAGAKAFITKPFQPEAVKEILAQVLASKG